MNPTNPTPVPTSYDTFMRGEPEEREEERQDRAVRQHPPPSGSLPEPPTSIPLL